MTSGNRSNLLKRSLKIADGPGPPRGIWSALQIIELTFEIVNAPCLCFLRDEQGLKVIAAEGGQ
jgi:hypothetical protein